jgi:hypothetical protein
MNCVTHSGVAWQHGSQCQRSFLLQSHSGGQPQSSSSRLICLTRCSLTVGSKNSLDPKLLCQLYLRSGRQARIRAD